MDFRSELVSAYQRQTPEFTNEAKAEVEHVKEELRSVETKTEIEEPVKMTQDMRFILEARYMVDEDKVKIRIVDPQKGEIVRFIPPEKFRDELEAQFKTMSGHLLDKYA